MPVVITFSKTDASTLEYWMPEDGKYYMPSIREKFPQDLWDKVDTQIYIQRQLESNLQKARAYFETTLPTAEATMYNAYFAVIQKLYAMDYGYIDKTGSLVVPLQYDTAFDFSEGLAGVRKNNKTGYIDKTGKVVIPLEYDSHDRRFSEGLVNVLKGGKWGYIDKSGKVAIPFQYASAEAFSNGMAAVSTDGAKFGYIDKTGQLAIPHQYGNNSDMAFRDGLARVALYDVVGFQKQMETKPSNEWTYQYGFIDKTGQFVVSFAEYVSNLGPVYSDGMINLSKNGKWTVLGITTQITKNITATFGATRYILGGEPFEQDSLLYNDTAYLPAAYLAAKLGLSVSWDSAANTTTLSSTEVKPPIGTGNPTLPAANPITRNITATFGATQYILNGEPFDEQTILYNDTAYLPAAYLARKLGLTADWDAAANITTLAQK